MGVTASVGHWGTLPAELRVLVRRRLTIVPRALLAATCRLNWAEDRVVRPLWLALGDKLHRAAMVHAIRELDKLNALDCLRLNSFFTVPNKTEVIMSVGRTLLTIRATFDQPGAFVTLVAEPRYRAEGWKWFADAVGTPCRYRDEVSLAAGVRYVVDHIEWAVLCGDAHDPLFGPYRTLRALLSDIHPWTPVAPYFNFAAAGAKKYAEYKRTATAPGIPH